MGDTEQDMEFQYVDCSSPSPRHPLDQENEFLQVDVSSNIFPTGNVDPLEQCQETPTETQFEDFDFKDDVKEETEEFIIDSVLDYDKSFLLDNPGGTLDEVDVASNCKTLINNYEYLENQIHMEYPKANSSENNIFKPQRIKYEELKERECDSSVNETHSSYIKSIITHGPKTNILLKISNLHPIGKIDNDAKNNLLLIDNEMDSKFEDIAATTNSDIEISAASKAEELTSLLKTKIQEILVKNKDASGAFLVTVQPVELSCGRTPDTLPSNYIMSQNANSWNKDAQEQLGIRVKHSDDLVHRDKTFNKPQREAVGSVNVTYGKKLICRKNFCPYCKIAVVSLLRHLVRNHSCEEKVSRYIALLRNGKDGSKEERWKIYNKLRIRGNNIRNKIILNDPLLRETFVSNLFPLRRMHGKRKLLANEQQRNVALPFKVTSKKYTRRRVYCLYCKTTVLNFARHVLQNHRQEEPVARCITLLAKSKDGSKDERRQIISELRIKGNNVHNQNILKNPLLRETSLSNLLPVKRSSANGKSPGNQFVICVFCEGMYSKKYFYLHAKRCFSRRKIEEELTANLTDCGGNSISSLMKRLQATKRRCVVTYPHVDEATSKLKEDVISMLKKDEVANMALTDPFFMSVAMSFFRKPFRPPHKNLIAQKIKDGSELLVRIKKKDPTITGLRDCLTPLKTDIILDTVGELFKSRKANGDLRIAPNKLVWVFSKGSDKALEDITQDESLNVEKKDLMKREIIEFLCVLNQKWDLLQDDKIDEQKDSEKAEGQQLAHEEQEGKVALPLEMTREKKNIPRVTIKTMTHKKKRIYCLYCKTAVTNFSRHLLKKHRHEEPVARCIDLLNKSKEGSKDERKKIFNELRNKGNNIHNQKILKDPLQREILFSNLIPAKRSQINVISSVNQFVTCRFCEGLYSKKYFYSHAQKCAARKKTEEEVAVNTSPLKKKGNSIKKYAMVTHPDVPEASSKLMDVLPMLNKDEITETALNDPLFMSVITSFLSKCYSVSYKYNAAKTITAGGKLLVRIKRKDSTITGLRDCLSPSKVNVVMETVTELYKSSDSDKMTPNMLLWVFNQGGAKALEDLTLDETLNMENKGLLKQEINEFLCLLDRDWHILKENQIYERVHPVRDFTPACKSDKEHKNTTNHEISIQPKTVVERTIPNSQSRTENLVKSRTSCGRKRWTEEEKSLVINEFKDFIVKGTLPSLPSCRELIAKHEQLAERTSHQIKVMIDNYNKNKLKLPLEFEYLKSQVSS